MPLVWLMDRESGEWLDTVIVRPPPKDPVTVGDMWIEIGRQIERQGYTIMVLDVADWLREAGDEIPEYVDYLAWVRYEEPHVPPGKKEWRPPEEG